MGVRRAAVALLAAAAGAMAAPASAETYLTGFGGIVFGGDLASGDAGDLDLDNRHGV
jgi:hypothetical protein